VKYLIIQLNTILKALMLLTLLSQPSLAGKAVIRSSVSPEYVNGLQAKFLKVLSHKLESELVITPMPFARRLIELEKGNIDLMVGLSKTTERARKIFFVEPPYYHYQTSFFIRKGEDDKLTNWASLQKLRVGLIINSKQFPKFDQDNIIDKHFVSSKEQLIRMLATNRIDTFIDVQDAGVRKINELGLAETLHLASFQPNKGSPIYIGISRKSNLMNRRKDIKSALDIIIQSNEYKILRERHYKKN
jgi:ABC-type amino acid transport substrate-binding protein